MRQRNTGKGSTYRIKTKVLWIRLIHEVFECADLRCGRRFVEKSCALVPSRTHWWGRKSCARKQHSTADKPWRRPTSLSLSLSLSLSPSLCFSFTLSFHLSKAHVPDVSTSRVFAAEIHSEVGKEATAKSVFWAGSKGGIISFLHGRLRFGRHYMIVRFDEEITRNSHVSGVRG
jgi:hypothetical protein